MPGATPDVTQLLQLKSRPSGRLFLWALRMFSLLNVEINASLDKFEPALWRAADVADVAMTSAAANADKFQTSFDRAAGNVGISADRMASDFEAANDRVMNAADQAAQSIDEIGQAAEQVDMRSWGEKVSQAFGAGVGAGVVAAKTWFDKVEEFAEAKMKAIGIGLAIGVVSAGAAAVYSAYRIISGSVGFLAGLITGDSYKSENIDALIKLNDEVKSLQGSMHVSAVEAGALNEALKATGVSSSEYVSAMDAATKSAQTNTDELDRLGVKYKDADGQLLSQRDLLKNAKAALDEYTEGYDRNAAAVAIGMGSYEAITKALSVTDEKIEASRQRLIDYNLVIGPGTQAAVSAYEESMLAFQRESELTGTGFKKAIADQLMPILTDLADFFRDGFPGVVNAFRYSMAILTSLFYGLKEVVYIVSESILQSFGGIGDSLSRVVSAVDKAMHGDYSGAWAELKAVPDDLGKRWDTYWGNLQAQSDRNVKAMKLAWGFDTLDAMSGGGAVESKKGKSWVPKPEEEKDKTTKSGPKDPNSYENFIQRLERENAALDQNEYTMLKIEAAQKAFAEGKSATLALMLIEERQILASDKAVRDFTTRLDEENQKLLAKRGAIGLVGIELDLYNMREQKRLEAIQRINEAERAGKPLTDEARIAVMERAEASAAAAEAIIRQNAAMERSFEVGAKKAFDTYLDNAANAAKNAGDLFTNAFRSMEDAMVKFTQTGKLDFKSLADSIIADLIRIQVRQSMTSLTSSMGGVGGIFGLFGKLFGGDSGNVGAGQTVANTADAYSIPVSSPSVEMLPSFDVGTDYVPKDMIALIHEGERITPKAFNPTIGEGGNGASVAPVVNVTVTNQASADGYQVTAKAKNNDGKLDIDLMVVKAIQKDVAKNGPISQGLGQAFGLSRSTR